MKLTLRLLSVVCAFIIWTSTACSSNDQAQSKQTAPSPSPSSTVELWEVVVASSKGEGIKGGCMTPDEAEKEAKRLEDQFRRLNAQYKETVYTRRCTRSQ